MAIDKLFYGLVYVIPQLSFFEKETEHISVVKFAVNVRKN